MDDDNIRFNCLHQAVETHPLRFNVEDKPSLDDLIERARKIEDYVRNG